MIEIDNTIPFIITYTAKKVSDTFNKKLMDLDITRVQWIALFYIGKYKNINQFELAKKMKINTSSIARLIDRMEKEGYVKREKKPNDRRGNQLVLADKGVKLIDILTPEDEKFNRLVLQNISNEEIAIFKEVLKKMEENITVSYV